MPPDLTTAPDVPGPALGWGGYSGALFICFFATGLAVLLGGTLVEANLVLVFLLSVVLATIRFGRVPGIAASLIAILAFDYFLVQPLHSLTVADPQYLVTFAIMLTVSLIISHLTADLQRQAQIADARAQRADVQFALSRDLASALSVTHISDIAAIHLASAFQGTGKILLADRDGVLDCSPLADMPGIGNATTSVMARAVFERQRTGSAADAVSATGALHFVPLQAPMRVRGVLILVGCQCETVEQVRLLQAFAAQIALAVERVHYVEVAGETAMAMESEKLRNSLLSAVSHDVRTPLAGIVGLASTLANTPQLAPDTVQELARAIQDDAARMNDLVTNLLDLARLQTAGPHVNREWQLIEEVIGSALACSSRVLGNMEVALSLPPGLPLLAFDAVLLERVLCNLLENAARHASAGRWIGVDASTNATELRVAVTDRGPGVPRGSEERIFAKFVHGSGLPARDGVGLGLAICRTIIEAHGGRIWVENACEGGACFVFVLPLGSPPDTSLLASETY
jgi:K+-sensing histidine kinase KdpD